MRLLNYVFGKPPEPPPLLEVHVVDDDVKLSKSLGSHVKRARQAAEKNTRQVMQDNISIWPVDQLAEVLRGEEKHEPRTDR